jgi:hypothetical protein
MRVHRNAVKSFELVWQKELAMAMRNFGLGLLKIGAWKGLLAGITALQWTQIGSSFRP